MISTVTLTSGVGGVCGPLRVLGAAMQEAGGTEGRDEAVPLAPVPALGII